MTLRSRTFKYTLQKLWVGARMRCPSCERGRLFKTFYSLNSTCPYCESRFERSPGESVGSLYINIVVAELTALLGFFTIHALFEPPITAQLMFWVPYLIGFSIVFYPVARGLWIAVLFLTGGVYPDPDYTREYYGPNNPISLHQEGEGEENG